MDIVAKLSSSDNYYIIEENIRDSDQYFLPNVNFDGIENVSPEHGICHFSNADEDIPHFLIPTPNKSQYRSDSLLLPDNDSIILMPETGFLFHEAPDDVQVLEYPPPEDIKDIINNDSYEDDLIIEHMDIRSPLNYLRMKIEQRVNLNLSNYDFWLQSSHKLHPEKNLVDQCVNGEGVVQINCLLTPGIDGGRIIIVDILKPENKNEIKENPAILEKTLVKWIVDDSFDNDMKRLNIPKDPNCWTKNHVKLWLVWAVREFSVSGVKLKDWDITGKELCDMTLETFQKKLIKDPDNVFWTHLELLRKCHVIAKLPPEEKEVKPEKMKANVTENTKTNKVKKQTQADRKSKKEQREKKPRLKKICVDDKRIVVATPRYGNSVQVQLWQFLLDLLTDKKHVNVIQWLSDDGQFRIIEPDAVAKLWGVRKNKPNMNYEKLSRALRYYYDCDMITKVSGKRFVYKFVCDLKEVLGYTPLQLHYLVTECALKNNSILSDVK